MILNKIIIVLLIQIILNYNNLETARSYNNNGIIKLPNDNCNTRLDLEYSWKELEYKFPSGNDKKKAIAKGDFVPGTGTPIDVDVECHGKNKRHRRVFVTIPRFETGIPFSLAEISKNGPKSSNGPNLKPYPNYNWHKDTQNGENCDRITSVFRISHSEFIKIVMMIRLILLLCIFFNTTYNQITLAQYYYHNPKALSKSYIHQVRYFGPNVQHIHINQRHLQENPKNIQFLSQNDITDTNVAPFRPSIFHHNHRRPPPPIVRMCYRNSKGLDLIYQWRDLEFLFPTRFEYENAVRNRFYVERASNPIDVGVEYKKNGKRRVFVTIPRLQAGVPFSLAYVSDTRNGPKGPALVPYPNYYWHSTTHHGLNCDGITSAFRVAIDPCNRMWVIDSGRIDDIQYCPPQLLVFDLNTDTLFHRYKFPNNVYKSGQSLFITPIVDTRDPPPTGHCLDSKVYIADVTAYGLVVYDSLQDDSWRIEHETMRSSNLFSNITIAGESFMLQDGIFGMAVTPHDGGERFLIYHGLANNIEVMVPLSTLDNKALWPNPNSNANAFQVIGRRNEQASAQAIDSRGNLYFGLVNTIGIGSWNYKSPWNGNTSAVYVNPETLQFASGLKVVKNQNNQEELWVTTNRFQKIMAGTLNSNEINFRIQKTLVNNLVC